MVRALSTICTGLGVTVASTFADSLGLSLQQEQIGFAIGIVLILVGCFFFVRGWKARAPERSKLLEGCYKDGQRLQERLAQHRPFNPVEAEDKARIAVYQWAEKTWKVLKQHFPGHEQDFLGLGPMVWAHNDPEAFNRYCEMEIQRLGNSASVFLESKLQAVAHLLNK